MIIIDQRKLRFLLAGRAIALPAGRRYRLDREYAVGVRADHPILQVQVLAVVKRDGGYTITIRRVSGDVVRLLPRSPASGRGYVVATVEAAAHDPRDALRGGLIDEPEPIDELTLARYAAAAGARDDLKRRETAAEQRKRKSRRYAVASSLPRKTGPAL